MPIRDFLDMMPRTMSWERSTSRDAYGKPATYATAKNYKVRVTREIKRVISQINGQDAISNTTVWVNGTFYPAVDDRFTLLAVGDLTVAEDVGNLVSWEAPEDETGAHHVKLYFNSTGGTNA